MQSKSTAYIVFLSVVIPILMFFMASRILFAPKVSIAAENYDITLTLNEYYLKVSDATYNTDTQVFTFSYYVKEQYREAVEEAYPSIFSIVHSDDLNSFIKYTSEFDGQYKTLVSFTVHQCDYIRIYFQSIKPPTTQITEVIDEFGNTSTIEEVIEYDEIYPLVIIPFDMVKLIDNTVVTEPSVVTTTTNPFFDATDAPSDTASSSDVSTTEQTTTTSEPIVTTVPTESSVPTTVAPPVITTAPTVVEQTTTTITTKPVITTTPSVITNPVTVTHSEVTTATTTSPVTTEKTTTTAATTKPATTTTVPTTAEQTTTTTTVQTTTENSELYIAVTGISLSTGVADNNIRLSVGSSSSVSPVITPVSATNQTVSWSSSNTSVASVSGGTIKALSPGVAIITCTTSDGGLRASCMVTVS